jgi:hypothetical protein
VEVLSIDIGRIRGIRVEGLVVCLYPDVFYVFGIVPCIWLEEYIHL